MKYFPIRQLFMPWAPHLCWTEFLPGDNKICPTKSNPHQKGDFKIIFVCLQDLLGNQGMILAATQSGKLPKLTQDYSSKIPRPLPHPAWHLWCQALQTPFPGWRRVRCSCTQTSGRCHVLSCGQNVLLFTSFSKSVCQPGGRLVVCGTLSEIQCLAQNRKLVGVAGGN